MIAPVCWCRHRELDHDGPCTHESCPCTWYEAGDQR